ncbi:hypothetical protein MLD38_000114 [Melastoma candidum]|uniref:Uncharacterized protein n=1 Tax=Melastoma candidum TaxID=119954 RepID=A0ACB9S8Z9_9MYRT|nr:hypothetical protein MLD38_000114 [Melastoma candidum]
MDGTEERRVMEGFEGEGVVGIFSTAEEPQDADYSQTPSLSDEVEVMILARIPRSEYGKLSLVSKRHLSLLKSGNLFKIRKEIGFREPSVFVLASGESSWWAFDRNFNSCRTLPVLPSDLCFSSGDKETLSAGTQLIVSGNETNGLVNWRYELVENKWFKGPTMKDLRCLFASATCGDYAYVAGGVRGRREVLSSAERYNPETRTWERLPAMNRRRKLCSGCYLDGKFYVVGGRNEEDGNLTCGEFFDEYRNRWEIIEGMTSCTPVVTYQSPPLIAVVNNKLYTLETSSNQIKVYLKRSNTWKTLGQVPIRADSNGGWGVAFKSLGDELLVIGGGQAMSYARHGMCIYMCRPDPRGEELRWKRVDCGKSRSSHFILNCCIMMA